MRRALRRGSGAEGSGAPARLGREESVPGAASAAFAAAGPPFGWGCLCFRPGRGAARVCPQLPDPADPQQTHVRRAAGNPAFSTALSVREGETPPSSRVPRIPLWVQRPGNRASRRGVGTRAPQQMHVRPAPRRDPGAQPTLASRRAGPAIVSASGRGAAGAAGCRRSTRTWKRYHRASGQTAGLTPGERNGKAARKDDCRLSLSPGVVHYLM